jgi:hypothetical protein
LGFELNWKKKEFELNWKNKKNKKNFMGGER